jgi:hypothetical protein
VDSREGEGEGGEDEERQFLTGPLESFAGGGAGRGGGGGGKEWLQGGGGWRAGVALNVLVAFAVLIAGFVCLIVATSGAALDAGRSAIFVGGCAAARGIDWGSHAAVSVVVVVLVAGANYAFQVLSSPTRDEVTAAHRRGEWLDIGVPSFRNLGRVQGSRMLLTAVVLVTAVFTQIMYVLSLKGDREDD